MNALGPAVCFGALNKLKVPKIPVPTISES